MTSCTWPGRVNLPTNAANRDVHSTDRWKQDISWKKMYISQ